MMIACNIGVLAVCRPLHAGDELFALRIAEPAIVSPTSRSKAKQLSRYGSSI
jgi:hypothetical protein